MEKVSSWEAQVNSAESGHGLDRLAPRGGLRCLRPICNIMYICIGTSLAPETLQQYYTITDTTMHRQ